MARSSRGALVVAVEHLAELGTWSCGHRIASAIACAPTSVSQQPRLPQWQSFPAGLKRRCPISPA